MLKKKIPGFIKTPVKFLLSGRDRRRILKERDIRKLQDGAIRNFNAKARKLIVFLVPGADLVTGTDKISGGVMSIVSLCEESARLKAIHEAEVIMCTLPNEHLLFKHTQFANQTDVFRFNQLQKYFEEAEEVLLHVPEFTCAYFLEYISPRNREWLLSLKKLHINILNQNIRLMPAVEVINQLKGLASTVTATTAHQRYCNQQYRQEYGIPLHKFSVWISPEKYVFRKYEEKKNLIIASPDQHPMKQAVLDKLGAIPGLRLQIIQNLTYEEYKRVIATAKWAITFGEGLDGYIIEPVFSGAIGFAVYNEEFFTPDFKELPTIYPSYKTLLAQITADIQKLDGQEAYAAYQQMQFDLCAKYYSESYYRQNIQAFYKGNYTLP